MVNIMADDVTTGGIASNPDNTGSNPAQTPAPAPAGAGVPVSRGAPAITKMPQSPQELEIPDVGLLRPNTAAAPIPAPPPTQTPSPKAAPIPPIQAGDAPQSDAMRDDIQKILGSIKLPERRTPQEAPKSEKQIAVAPIEEHLETPSQVTQEPERPSVTTMHTLKDDIQHVVREDKMSLVRAASLEEDRKIREQEPEPSPAEKQRRSRTTGMLFAAALLVFLGIAALFGVLLVMNNQSSPPVVEDKSAIIFAEQSFLLPIDNVSPGALKQQIAQLRTAQVGSLGSITRIIPTLSTTTGGTLITRPATTQEFLYALGSTAPIELLRSLDTNFFFGLHSADENAPVFVIPVLSYDNAFAAMLTWENAMNADLVPLFTSVSPYSIDQTGIPQARRFKDTIIRNYDTRTLSDDTDTIQLYYSFPSQNILVIAESPYTFSEVLNRLRAQRRL